MILTTLLLGAGLLVGGTLVASFWNEIVDWLKRAVVKVKQMIDMAVYGTKVFIKKMYEAIKEISKHYSQDKYGQWHETVVTREVPENQVPPEIRAMAERDRERDITDKLELQLQ